MHTRIILIVFVLFSKFIIAQETITDYFIVTSDKDSLATDIYIPKGAGPFPVILMRTPYDKRQRKYGKIFNDNGYVYIVQDVRGRVKSSGPFKGWIDEELDGFETIEWIIKQNWSDGNVGLIGSSYSAYAAMQIASTNHPAIKAVVNNSGPIDLYNVIFPGGVFHNTALLPWTMAFTQHRGFNFPPYESGLSMDQLARQKPLNDAFTKNNYTGTFWNYLVNHQTRDGYWRMLNVSDTDQIDIPILHVTGWFDFIASSAIDGYLNIAEGQKRRNMPVNQEIQIGPWIHDDMMNGRTEVGEIDYGDNVKVGRDPFLEMSINYFDRYLKPKVKLENETSKVTYFDIGSKQWIEANEWPSTNEKVYYLNSEGNAESRTLSPRSSSSYHMDSFTFNPNDPVNTLGGANIHFPFFGETNGIRTQNSLENRADILFYTSDPLTEDMYIFGKIKANLFVSTSAEDADFTVKINQIHPDGTITNIRDGIQRLSLSKSLSYRSFVASGTVNALEVDLGYISAMIPKGSKINIQVSSSNYPKFSLNPGTVDNPLTTDEFISAKQTLHLSPQYKSAIHIPVRKR